MPKKETGFKGVGLKTKLCEDIKRFIDEHPELGYKSVSDFVQEATRLKIQALKKIYSAKP